MLRHLTARSSRLPALAALAALAALGCRDAAPPPARAPVAEPAKTAEAPQTAETTVRGTAAPTDPAAIEKAAARKAKLHALRAGVRQAHFEAQLPVPLPADAPADIARLVPPTARLVEYEIHRRMHGLKPADGRRIVLRWLTRLEGDLAEALARRAVGQWSGAMPPEGAREVTHPVHGALRWTVHTPEERATRVELVLERPQDDAAPLPPLDGAPWRSALEGATVRGFEHGRYHAQRGSSTYTDLERLSAIVETADGPGLQRRLEDACRAAGYVVDDDDPRLLRAPGTARTTFTTRLAEGRLTLHHQRRWRRTPATPKRTDGPAAAP